jgi:hypothetical protein
MIVFGRLKYMFQDLPDYFTVLDEKNKDLYDLYKNNIVGSPSIIFQTSSTRTGRTLLFCILVGFQVLTITKTRSQVGDNVEKLQLETSPVPVETAVGTVPTRTSRGWFQHGEI